MGRQKNPERVARSRELLLSAAAAEFYTEGFTGASMSAIVARANLTKGAAYFHFASKEALAAAVVQAQYDRWPQVVEDVRAEGTDPLDVLVRLVYRVGRMFREDPIVRAGVRLAAERHDIDAELPVPYVGWIAVVGGLLGEARHAGQLDDRIDTEAAARVIVAAFLGVQSVSDTLTARRDLDERLDELWAFLMPALRGTVSVPTKR